MWMFYLVLVYTVFLPSISLVTSFKEQPSKINSYLENKRVQWLSTDNVLWNKQPPTASTNQLSSVVIFSNEILKLNCNINGNPRPTYQWYVSTDDLTEKPMAIHSQSFTMVDKGNNHILELDGNKTPKMFSKYIYYCSAKNSLGTLHLNNILVEKVTRREPAVIKYVFHQVVEGEKYVVKCQMVPELPELYTFKRWEVRFRSGETLYLNKTVGRFSVISTTKFPQLHIRNISNEELNYTTLRCMFLRTIEDNDDITNNQFIPIEKLNFRTLLSPQITCTEEVLTVNVGENVELPWCTIPTTESVDWFKLDDSSFHMTRRKVANDVNDTKFSRIGGLHGNLFIFNVTRNDAGKYLAVGINSLQSTFTLKVHDVPSISISPKDSRNKLSESAEFNCSLTVYNGKFSWIHNGLKVVSGYDDGNIEVTVTDKISTLKVHKVRPSVSGVFQCLASFFNVVKYATDFKQSSATLLLSEIPPTLFKQSPRIEEGTSEALIQMSSTNKLQTIECVFTANPRPKIDWYINSKKVPITESISITLQEDEHSIYNFITKLTINLNEMNNNEDILELGGEYQARATNAVNSTFCKTFVLMTGPLEIHLPTKQVAISGKDRTLQCYFRAAAIPEFTWHRKVVNKETWELLPMNHRTHRIRNGHNLLITNVIKAEDEGIYKCTIVYNGESREATTMLSVVHPPILQELPATHDSSQSQTHICTIKSIADKPWYSWWTFTKFNSTETLVISPDTNNPMFSVHYSEKSNGNYEFQEVPDFVYKYPNIGVGLTVVARPYDKKSFGRFVCHAKNGVGSDEKSIEDRFRKLEFGISPPDLSYIVLGDDLHLDCSAKESDLQSTVVWKIIKEDTSYGIIDFFDGSPNRIFQYQNGTVMIKDVKEGDPCKLICFISSKENIVVVQSKIAYIEIRIPARVQKLEKENFKVLGSSFNLSCSVYGNNHNMSIIWFYRPNLVAMFGLLHETCVSSTDNQCRNQYQRNSGKFNPVNEIINDTYSKVHLEFSDVTESISGQYKCEARNKYNKVTDQTNTTLIIITKPSIVITDSSVTSSTSTSISFDWMPPEKNGNKPIIRYIILYSKISSAAYNDEQKNVTQKIIRVNDTVHALVIDQLRPYHKYTVKIAAENEVGVGEAASIYVETLEEKPTGSVNNLVASSINHHEILVSWADPDAQYQNGHITRYEICYQILQILTDSRATMPSLNWPAHSDTINPNSSVKCESTEKRMIAISYLPQFTDFAIRVVAFNSKGSSPPQYTRVRTLEDLPKAPPNKVTCEGRHQAIELTWNPPGRHTINGVLIGYAVYYQHPNPYFDESDMKSISVQGRTHVMLHQLKPYTRYSIQIMAVNRMGLGPPSASVHCTTKEAKPEAPESVKAWKINDTCIFISWLHTQNPNGAIREYCVIDMSIRKPTCQAPDMYKRYNTMTFCHLNERFPNVNVYAKNTYEGAPKEVSVIDYMTSAAIISIGGVINVNEGSSVILPCETTTTSYKKVYWKKENGAYITSENQNLKVLKNFSLEITSIEKFGSQTYTCSTDSDSVEYSLNVQESNNGIPQTPIIDDSRLTETSVFIRWKSRGTRDLSAPITKFIVTWENLYSGYSKTVHVDGNSRSFYLKNVTCASDFVIKLSSQNAKGKSKPSDPMKLRTIGSVPHIADNAMLLPASNVDSNSANFNLLAFTPGDNCSATFFVLEISLSNTGSLDFSNLVSTKNISARNLENNCCCKITGLKPATTYKYRINAYNPAGPTENHGSLETRGVNGAQPTYFHTGTSRSDQAQHSWLLMIILVIVIAFILIISVVAVLYAMRSKEKKALTAVKTVATRQSDYNQNRIEKPGKAEDTISIDSEPSPYAVYQPDVDPKMGKIWTQQVSQQSSTPLYNYTDHHYNQIRYDKIPGRIPMGLDNYHDNYRRANSAECLSSVGNASVTGMADLESPSNIDRNVSQDYFRAPFNHCANTDEVFQNIRIQDFSTINRRRMRTEDDNQWRHNQERARMMNNNGNQGPMNRSQYYEPTGSRIQRQIYPSSGNSGHHNNYHQQISVPEPRSIYQHQYGYPSSRVRSSNDSGHGHPSSQNMLTNNPGSSAQVASYGSYYGSRANNVTSYAQSSGVRGDNEPANNQYSSYIAGSNLSNYNPPHRTVIARPALQPLESPDEGIYTDRVVVV